MAKIKHSHSLKKMLYYYWQCKPYFKERELLSVSSNIGEENMIPSMTNLRTLIFEGFRGCLCSVKNGLCIGLLVLQIISQSH